MFLCCIAQVKVSRTTLDKINGVLQVNSDLQYTYLTRDCDLFHVFSKGQQLVIGGVTGGRNPNDLYKAQKVRLESEKTHESENTLHFATSNSVMLVRLLLINIKITYE